MNVEEPEIKGEFEGYRCANCRREKLHAFVSHGARGEEAAPFTTIDITPCEYCSHTKKLMGMRIFLGYLIEERQR